MNFIEALNHLKEGSIITSNGSNFYKLIGKKIWCFFYYNNQLCRMPVSFSSDNILTDKWRILTLEEENQLGLEL